MQRHGVKFCIFGSLAFYFALNMFYQLCNTETHLMKSQQMRFFQLGSCSLHYKHAKQPPVLWSLCVLSIVSNLCELKKVFLTLCSSETIQSTVSQAKVCIQVRPLYTGDKVLKYLHLQTFTQQDQCYVDKWSQRPMVQTLNDLPINLLTFKHPKLLKSKLAHITILRFVLLAEAIRKKRTDSLISVMYQYI